MLLKGKLQNLIDRLKQSHISKVFFSLLNTYISENGKNLTRKFEGILERNKKIELYSDNDIKKNYTLIIEKLN